MRLRRVDLDSPGLARRRYGRGVVFLDADGEQVAGELGNTVAVSRASYVDPQVVAAFERGETIPADAAAPWEVDARTDLSPAERAVLALLS